MFGPKNWLFVFSDPIDHYLADLMVQRTEVAPSTCLAENGRRKTAFDYLVEDMEDSRSANPLMVSFDWSKIDLGIV